MVTIPQPITMLSEREQRIAITYDEFHALIDKMIHAEWANGAAVIFMPPEDRHQALLGFLHLSFAGSSGRQRQVIAESWLADAGGSGRI